MMTAEYLQHDSTPPSSQTRSLRQGVTPDQARIVGQSEAIQNLVRSLHVLAMTSNPVLVSGERGTGKALVARALHQTGPRREGPFVHLACQGAEAPVSEEVLEMALASATGGTLFLEGIEHLPAELQRKLSEVGADVRLVASASLEGAAGLDADLRARFADQTLGLPSLAERVEDLRPLARHFFDVSVARLGRRGLRGISPEALAALEGHSWADNVRGLARAVEAAVQSAEGPYVTVSDLPEELRQPLSSAQPRISSLLPAQGMDLRAELEQYETRMILQALERTGWNKNRAAGLLGLNRTTLVEMIKRKRLAPPMLLRSPMGSAALTPARMNAP